MRQLFALTLFTCAALFSGTAVCAQVVQLSEDLTGETTIRAAPGDTVRLNVSADFGRFAATGLTVYLRLPAAGFEIVGAAEGGNPFTTGPLFAHALVVRNREVEAAGAIDAGGSRLLEFSALFGPGADRASASSGHVADLRLRCLGTAPGIVAVHQSPLHESRIVLADGRLEAPLRPSAPVRIEMQPATAITPASWARLKRVP